MRKLWSLSISAALAVSLLTGCGSSSKPAESTAAPTQAQTETKAESGEKAESQASAGSSELKSYTFKLGYHTVEDSVRGEMANEFKRIVEEKSGGRLKVELYPSETLGNEQEMIEAVKIGAVDFSLPGGGAMSNVDPVFGSISLPFFMSGYDAFHEQADGELGEYWGKVAEENGYKLLSIGDLGFAQITNNKRPINTVEDLKGLKMRSPNEQVLINSFQNLGAAVTTLPFTEIYMALSQGVVDGQFNPLDAIYQTKFHEVQDYLAIVNIFCYNINFITNKALWDGLDPEAQDIIQEAADAAKEISREYYTSADTEYLELVTPHFKEITYPELEEFRKAVQPVYDEFAQSVPADYAEKFLK
ncbi:MAG: DctP family TRAP transporter solute-binding subunit [Hungatella sp.]|jgi:tripartite ATP-independent transporter DctP family solute receptor|nr:DctP family TRAP transporter solute-binding subunit [Hungatella sp.]